MRLLLGAALTAVCLSANSTPSSELAKSQLSAIRPIARSTAPDSLEDLQRRLAIADRALDRDFLGRYSAGEQERKALSSARAMREARVARCSDNRCRRQVIADELNRTRYALGLNQTAVGGMPWETGSVDLRLGYLRDDGSAATSVVDLNVYPLPDGRVLAILNTLSVPDATWICDTVVEGRIAPGPALELRALDWSQQRYRMRRVSAGRWDLEQVGVAKIAGCGWVDGVYQVDASRHGMANP